MNHDEEIDSVLRRLISERDKLDVTIQTLMLLKSNGVTNNSLFSARSVDGFQSTVGFHSNPDNTINSAKALAESNDKYWKPYKGMTLLHAIKKLLLTTMQPLNATQMAQLLAAGGFHFDSETPQNTVASTLSRALSDNDKEVVKVDRGLWIHINNVLG